MSSISSTQTLALLLSGGVDSAVALHLLCEQGIRPDCFYIRIGPEDKSDEPWDCSSEEDLEMETFFSLTRKLLVHYLLGQYSLESKAEAFNLAAH